MTTITLRFPKGDVEAPIKKVIEFHGIKCALHRTKLFVGRSAGWTVSEISTGMAVGYGATMPEAIKDAGLRAEKYNAAAWKKAIKLAVTRLKKRDSSISQVKAAEARLASEGVKIEGETEVTL